MSSDGRWRFGMDHRGERMLVDLANDPTGHVDLSQDPAFSSVVGDLESRYTAWHDRQRCLFEGVLARETIVISDRGLQRTPGYYGVTWAFAVHRPAPDDPPFVLASQENVGDVTISGDQVAVTLYGRTLAAKLDDAADCHTVAITTQATHPGLLNDRDEGFRAVLYVNDTPRGELVLDRLDIFDQHRAELRVHPAGGVNRAYRVWTEFLGPDDSTERPGISRATRGLSDLGSAG